MIYFKSIELEDKQWIKALTSAEGSRSADFSFGNMYMWDKSFNQCVAGLDGRLIAKPCYKEHPFFAYPVGSGDLIPVIKEMLAFARTNGFAFIIRGVTKEHIPLLKSAFPGRFSFSEEREHFDYIYLAEKLASLEGKKMHAKRNHINRFTDSNDWRFAPLTPDLIPNCLKMLEQWTISNSGRLDRGLRSEHTAITRCFDNYSELELEGGVLFSGEELIAFAIGEIICRDTFDVHFEKARADIQGAYPMINREFSRHILKNHSEILYINREDDMGYENLRRAKMSYYPDFMIEKHLAIWNG